MKWQHVAAPVARVGARVIISVLAGLGLTGAVDPELAAAARDLALALFGSK